MLKRRERPIQTIVRPTTQRRGRCSKVFENYTTKHFARSSNRLWKESRSYYHGKYHKQSHQYGKTDEAQAENGNDVSQPV